MLNADLFGEWQKNKLNGTFQKEYCGGASDKECETFQEIKVREAMLVAIELEKNYTLKNGKTIAEAYDLSSLKGRINEKNIKNNIKGWVQSQNFMFKEFSPDVSFGWVINLWNPGSAHWVHKQYMGERDLWTNASKSVAVFTKWIGAYDDNKYRPDFLTFDKYERDGFGAAGKPSYAFSSRAWDNYLMYVKQITDFLDTPAMLWQIPGGHLVSKNENLENDRRLCSSGDSNGCFRHLDTGTHGGHSATGGSYFMGDKNIGTNVSNIREDVLNIKISGVHYNGATNAKELLEQTDYNLTYNWGESKLRQAAFSNAFAILWGGGETTGSVPISTNKTGGYAWLRDKIVNYQNNGKIPLYHKKENTVATSDTLTSLPSLNKTLESKAMKAEMNKNVLIFKTTNAWIPSSIYKWEDFLTALKSMHNAGVAGDKFWLFDEDGSTDEQKSNYAKVAIATFLAQSMQETIQYDACDENSWQFLKDIPDSESVKESYERGDFSVNLPLDAACGQLGQVYSEYGVDKNGKDNPYSCPRTPKMEVTAVTNSRSYGGAAPLFSAPNAVLENLGLLIDGKPGRWDYDPHCNGTPGDDINFTDPKLEGWVREDCKVYKKQRAGLMVWDGSSKRDLQGCSWWGRGVIQSTGRENIGKLNHFIGRSHVDKDTINKDISWAGGTVHVESAPQNPLYANMDLCSNPELICSSTKSKEIKWIAGLFFWMNSVQGFDKDDGKYKDWNYKTEIKKYVDSNFGKNNYKPLNGTSLIDAISGIVNRGCPDDSCPVSGKVHKLKNRANNFKKVLKSFGIE